MAFITFSGLVTSIRGKLNGSYFQGQKGGTQIKTIGSPHFKNRQTASGLRSQQNLVARVSRAWQQLGEIGQAVWNAYASTLERVNKNGQVYTPSGYQIFQEFNINSLNVGGAIQSAPDDTPSPLKIEDFNVVNDSGDLKLVGANIESLITFVTVFASAPQSLGTNYARGGYKRIGVFQCTADLESSLNAAYESVFGARRINTVIFFKLTMTTQAGRTEGAKLTKADGG